MKQKKKRKKISRLQFSQSSSLYRQIIFVVTLSAGISLSWGKKGYVHFCQKVGATTTEFDTRMRLGIVKGRQ